MGVLLIHDAAQQLAERDVESAGDQEKFGCGERKLAAKPLGDCGLADSEDVRKPHLLQSSSCHPCTNLAADL